MDAQQILSDRAMLMGSEADAHRPFQIGLAWADRAEEGKAHTTGLLP